ncbi:MAG: sulfatase [Rikenellaceae bacterium]
MKSKLHSALLATAAGVAAVPFVSCGSGETTKPLNILYIMSDDHTSQAIGAYGSRLAEVNPTPNIDAFAAESVTFDNCFCGNGISTPSRATIMTGQYSHTNGVLTLDEEITEDQQYLAQEMKALGYQTAMVGKWHLGCEPSAFDYYNIFTSHGQQGSYFDPVLASSDNTDKKFPFNITKHEGYCSDIVTDISLDWLENRRDKDQPFFLMHHFKAPHDNFEFAPRYAEYLADVEIPYPATLFDREAFGSEGTRGVNNSLDYYIGSSVSSRNTYRNYTAMYKIEGDDVKANTIAAYNEYLKRYLRCVKGVDDNIERIFTYLKENDLWDNTIIIYTADQGMFLGEHDLQDKRWMYDEGMRMPYIMRVPGMKVEKGSHEDLMISNIDFAPTLLSLAGREKSPEYMQGRDFSSYFEGETPSDWRTGIYYRYWMHMMHHNVPAHFGIRTADYKLIFFYGRHYDIERKSWLATPWEPKNSATLDPTPSSFELYDMKNDPYETTNLANDPQYAEVLERLKAELLELKKQSGDNDVLHHDIQEIIDANFGTVTHRL